MIAIRWIVTDELNNVSKEEFDTDWNGIYGYFELTVNGQSIGFCPQRELFEGEEGDENILYWLTELYKGIQEISAGREYETQLLSMNLARLVFSSKDGIYVRLQGKEGSIWSEKVDFNQLKQEVDSAIHSFTEQVREKNSALLSTKHFQKMHWIEMKP